jgi:hypothetical protein
LTTAWVTGFLLVAPAFPAELKPATVAAFNHYVELREARMAEDLAEGRFLLIDRLPDARREQIYAQVRAGQMYIQELRAREDSKSIPVPSGLIHDWAGVAFIPGATLEQTLAVLEDYDNHKNIYKPSVRDSKLLEHNGNDFKVYLQFYRKSLVTIVVNMNVDVEYTLLENARAMSKSYSTRIAEVENAGKPEEHERPVGNDHGYIWRLYTYWRLVEKDDGVYVEVETIALSRGIPKVWAWLINPLTKSIPRDVLSDLLRATRKAVTKPTELEGQLLLQLAAAN